MSHHSLPVIPLTSFKNIVVTAFEDAQGVLHLSCLETIGCSSADTLLNFQLVNASKTDKDYRFEPPVVVDKHAQLGAFTIGKSGKMLTACNATSEPSIVNITLKAFDFHAPHKKASFDPEVQNQPDGVQLAK